MGFKLVDTRDSLRVIFCCYAYDATCAAGAKRNTNDMIRMCSKYFLILELLVKQADNMEMAVFLDYKPTDVLSARSLWQICCMVEAW